MKELYLECPKQYLDEFSSIGNLDDINKIVDIFYNGKYKKKKIIRVFFDAFCSFDKTFLTLTTGSITGVLINIISSILEEYNNVVDINKPFLFLQLFIVMGITVSMIIFTTNIINIQESASNYFPKGSKITEKQLHTAKRNIVFYFCVSKWKSTITWLCFCIVLSLLYIFTTIKEKCLIDMINKTFQFYRNLDLRIKCGITIISVLFLGGVLICLIYKWKKLKKT